MKYIGNISRSGIAITTLSALFFIGFYILAIYTPLYVDDYFFSFFSTPDSLPMELPAVYEYLSFYTDRFAGVSRFIPHLAVAFFSILTGKWLFNILSAIGFIALCRLLTRTASADRDKRLMLFPLTAALIWFVMPGFYQGVLWMSGACNYLLTAIIVTAFYLLFVSGNQTLGRWWHAPICFAAGIITGWTNEGFIVGLTAGCTLHMLLHREQITDAEYTFTPDCFAERWLCACRLTIYHGLPRGTPELASSLLRCP